MTTATSVPVQFQQKNVLTPVIPKRPRPHEGVSQVASRVTLKNLNRPLGDWSGLKNNIRR
jgi:hypothetical protein